MGSLRQSRYTAHRSTVGSSCTKASKRSNRSFELTETFTIAAPSRVAFVAESGAPLHPVQVAEEGYLGAVVDELVGNVQQEAVQGVRREGSGGRAHGTEQVVVTERRRHRAERQPDVPHQRHGLSGGADSDGPLAGVGRRERAEPCLDE